LPSSGEFVVTRVFDAPRALVFEVWTVPEHLACWFGPRAATIVVRELDARPGGALHFGHRLSGGVELWARGIFQEVVPPERLVFTGEFVDAHGRPGRHPLVPEWPTGTRIETTVLFDEVDRGTKVTVCQRVEPAEAAALEAVAHERRQARQGWSEVFDRLSDHLQTATGHGERT
jgi:uncharacterized protein YndB with AHSA1/START domain